MTLSYMPSYKRMASLVVMRRDAILCCGRLFGACPPLVEMLHLENGCFIPKAVCL